MKKKDKTNNNSIVNLLIKNVHIKSNDVKRYSNMSI